MERASDVLLAARQLIQDESKWWQPGNGIGGGYCMHLAVAKVSCHWVDDTAHTYLANACGGPNVGNRVFTVVEFNDTHTHAEVLAAFNKAIGLALKSEGPRSELPALTVTAPAVTSEVIHA